jgi:hypothetical protein
MSAAEVRQQVEHVALVTKQGSSVSDLRRFQFAAQGVKVGRGGAGWCVCVCATFAATRPAACYLDRLHIFMDMHKV